MLLIYGATGYSGGLVLREVLRRGIGVIGASRSGRSLDGVEEVRKFAVDTPDLDGVTVVLNCAGPFSKTAVTLARACLKRGVHYLDLAGEVDEHLALHALDSEARDAGVVVVPGVGFGCVPTELAAVAACQRLDGDVQHLLVAYDAVGGASRGTLDSVLRSIHEPGVHRVDGELVPIRPGADKRTLDLGEGEVKVVTNPWRADLVACHASTGAPSIDTYATFPFAARALMTFPGFTGSSVGCWLVDRVIAGAPPGPSAAELDAGRTNVLARATSAAGAVADVRIRGPEAYKFTAQLAAAMASRALETSGSGVCAPSSLMDLAALCAIDGVEELT